jgi:hypothetical protein
LFNAMIGIVILLAGLYFMFKFFGSSPSLKKRDEHNKTNPTDDSIYPPNTPMAEDIRLLSFSSKATICTNTVFLLSTRHGQVDLSFRCSLSSFV